MYRDAEDYLTLLRDCSNAALKLARDLRLAAEIAPEEACIAPCINLAGFLEREAKSMNPERPTGDAKIIQFIPRRKYAETMES